MKRATVQLVSCLALVVLCACKREASVSMPEAVNYGNGLHYRRISERPDEVVHTVSLELPNKHFGLRVSKKDERGKTVRSFAKMTKSFVAINGDFYNPENLSPIGISMGAGQNWAGNIKELEVPFLACDEKGHCVIDEAGEKKKIDASWQNVISGQETLMVKGRSWQRGDDFDCGPFCVTPLPRSAIGLSQDRKKLMLFVAEGRLAGKPGLTLSRLAEIIKAQGMFDAFNLDGGGSSQMVIDGKLVSARPGDEPEERGVGNCLGIVKRQ